tara:strand:+ start:10370 stop:11887 length:1518 start_codon:yes stop_codon:yes gene_type:complete
MPIAKVNFSIPPLNDSNTTTNSGTTPASLTGGFTNTKGNPTVKFSIPAQDRLLNPTQMFLTGQVVHFDAASGTYSDNDGLDGVNGAIISKAGNLQIPTWNGLQSLIQKVMIQSKKSPVELMNVNNYGLYNSIRTGNSNNEKDYLCSPLSRYCAAGANAKVINRHSVLVADATDTGGGTMTNLDNFNDEQFGIPFSFRIDTGLMNSGLPLHLGESRLGGLLLTLHLANENGFYCRAFRDVVTVVNSVDGSFYRIKNLRLEGRYEIPTPQEASSYPEMIPIQERANLINDVTSSVNATTYTPQLSMVKSFINLFLDQNQENNIQQSQSNFRVPLGLQDYTQNKNSIRTPEDYVLEAVPSLNILAAGIVYNNSDLALPIYGQGLAEVRNRFQRAVLDGELAGHTSATIKVTSDELEEQYATGAAGNVGVGRNAVCDLMGVGLDFSHSMSQTQNFQNQDYTLRLKSGVDTSSAKFPAHRSGATGNGFALQNTFVRNLAVFNTQSLVKSQ